MSRELQKVDVARLTGSHLKSLGFERVTLQGDNGIADILATKDDVKWYFEAQGAVDSDANPFDAVAEAINRCVECQSEYNAKKTVVVVPDTNEFQAVLSTAACEELAMLNIGVWFVSKSRVRVWGEH